MNKVSYSGRSNPGRFKNVQLPDDSKKIIQQGQEIIKGMEAYKAADLANRTAMLQAMKENYALENRWRDKNKTLEDAQRDQYQKATLKNYEIDKQNARTQGQNTERVVRSLTQFSDTLAGIMNEQAQEQANEQALDMYWKTMMGGIPPEEQVGFLSAEHDLSIEGEKIEQRADLAQSLGAAPSLVDKMRGMNKAQKYGYQKAIADNSAQKFSYWLAERMIADNETKVITAEGKTITPSEAVTYKEKEAATAILWGIYMRQQGLVGLDSRFLAPALTKMRNGMTTYLNNALETELEYNNKRRLDEAESVFRNNPNPDNAQKLMRAYRRNGKSFGDAIAWMGEQKTFDGNFMFSKSDFEQMMLLPDLENPGKTLGATYAEEFANAIAGQRKVRRAFGEGLEKDRTLKDQETLRTLQDEFADGENYESKVERYLKEIPLELTKSRKFLEDLVTFEDQRDEEIERQWTQDLLSGNLTFDAVWAETKASLALKQKFASQLSRGEGITKRQQSWAEELVKTTIGSKKDYPGIGKMYDGTYATAKVDQIQAVLSRFNENRKTMSDAEAMDEAQRWYREEWAKGEPPTTEKGAMGTGLFARQINADNSRGFVKYNQVNQPRNQQAVQEAIEKISIDRNIWQREAILPPTLYLKALQKAEYTGRLEVPDEIADIVRAANGAFSATEFMNAQAEANGLNQYTFEYPQFDVKEFTPTARDVRIWRQFQTPITADRAIISQGGTNVYTNASQADSMRSAMQIMMQTGIPNEDLAIMAAVMMAESGGDPTIDTVKSGLDPSRQNEYSIGLMQINWKVHQSWLESKGFTEEDMRDPQRNIEAATLIYQQQGKTAWGAYDNGKGPYLDYLEMAEVIAQQLAYNNGSGPWAQGQNMAPGVVRELTAADTVQIGDEVGY